MPIDSGSGGGGTLKPGGEAYGDNLLTTALEVTTTSQNLPIQLEAGKWYGLLFSDGTASEPGPMLSWQAPAANTPKSIAFSIQEYYKVDFTIGASTTAMQKRSGTRTLYLREIRLDIARRGARGGQGIPGDAFRGGSFSENVLPNAPLTLRTANGWVSLGVRLEPGRWVKIFISDTAEPQNATDAADVHVPADGSVDVKRGILGSSESFMSVRSVAGRHSEVRFQLGTRSELKFDPIDIDAIRYFQSAKGDSGVGTETLYAVGPTRTLNANQHPSNDWRYGLVDADGNAITASQNGIQWHKTPQSTTTTNKYPFVAERRVVGIPDDGDEVSAQWSVALQSEPGSAGAAGDDASGTETIYAVHSINTLTESQQPVSTWKFGQPQTRDVVAWNRNPQNPMADKKYPFWAKRKITGDPAVGATIDTTWAWSLIAPPGRDGSGPSAPTSPLGYEPPWSFIRQSTTAGPVVGVNDGNPGEIGNAWNMAAGKHGDWAKLGLEPTTSSFSFSDIPSDSDTNLHVIARMRISYQLFHGTIELLIKETDSDAQTRVTSLDTITLATPQTLNTTMRTPNGVMLKARRGRTYKLFIKGTPKTAKPGANVGFWNGGVTDEDGIWLAKAEDVAPDASETVAGKVRRATAAEVQAQAAVNAFVPPNLVSSAMGQISVGSQASDVDPIADRVIDEEDLSDILKAKVLSEYSLDVTDEVAAVVCSQYVGRGEPGNDKPYSTATIGTPLNASLPSIYQRGAAADSYDFYKRGLEFSQNPDLTAQEGARAYGLNIEQLDELANGDRLLLYATLYTADNSSVERVIFALQSGSNTVVALYRTNNTTIEARVGDTRIVNRGVGEMANRFFKVGMYIKRTGPSGFEFRIFGGGASSDSATATISGLSSTTVTVGINPTYVQPSQRSQAIASSFRGLMFDVVVMHPTQDATTGWASRTSYDRNRNDRTVPYGNAMHIRLVQRGGEYQYMPGDNLVGSTPQALSPLNAVTSITLGATGVDLDKILGFWAEFKVNGRGYRQFLPVEFIPRRTGTLTSTLYALDESTGLVSHYDPGIIVVSKGAPSPNSTGDHWYFTALLASGSAVALTLDFWPGTISNVRSASVTSLRVVQKRR